MSIRPVSCATHYVAPIVDALCTAVQVVAKFIIAGIPEIMTLALEKYNWWVCPEDAKERGYIEYGKGIDTIPPLFLIHGRFGKMSSFDAFAKNMRQCGFDGRIIALDVSICDRDTIEKGAEKVDEKIRELLGSEWLNRPEIYLAGHSQGGDIAAYYNETYQWKNVSVKGVATLGSPLCGTKMAWFSDKQTYEELSYNSPFTQDLCFRVKNSSTPYHFSSAFFDYFVVPSKGSAIPDSEKPHHTYYGWGGHSRMKRDYGVAKAITKWMTEL